MCVVRTSNSPFLFLLIDLSEKCSIWVKPHSRHLKVNLICVSCLRSHEHSGMCPVGQRRVYRCGSASVLTTLHPTVQYAQTLDDFRII